MDSSANEILKLRKKVEELEAQLQKKELAKGKAFNRKLLRKTGLKQLSAEELEALKDDYTNLLEGKTPLIDVYRIMEIKGDELEDAKGESDTLAGFMIEQAGKILQKNEKVKFNQFIFTVEAADKRKVKQVKVSIDQNGEE